MAPKCVIMVDELSSLIGNLTRNSLTMLKINSKYSKHHFKSFFEE